MSIRRIHKMVGLVLMAPFFGWALTGLVFFLKPGYEGAYEILGPKTYPMTEAISIEPDPAWLEFRCFKTVLGEHLIARTASGWRHLDPRTKQQRPVPTEDEMNRLVTDAVSANPQRYGRVIQATGDLVKTDTGVEIKIDWDRLSLQQRGRDTERLDSLYRVHYLQWTGSRIVDRLVGLTGILLVIALTLLGGRLAFKGS